MLLMNFSHRRRVCVMLRASGASYGDIAAFAGITVRLVRYELEQATKGFPGIIDHNHSEQSNRLFRLVYCLGASDAGADLRKLPELLDSLDERSRWLRTRMANRAALDAELGRAKLL